MKFGFQRPQRKDPSVGDRRRRKTFFFLPRDLIAVESDAEVWTCWGLNTIEELYIRINVVDVRGVQKVRCFWQFQGVVIDNKSKG